MVDQQQLLDLLEYLLSKYDTSFVGTVSSAGIGKILYVDIGGTVLQATSLNVDAPGEVAIVADSNGNFYCFKVGGVNLKRNRVITNRKFRYTEKNITELDVAVLYAVRETKSSPVNFVNPTWDLGGDSTGYICIPRPEGDRGEYPDEATCMQQANEYWQELVDSSEEEYLASYAFWQEQLIQREQAYAAIDQQLPWYLERTSIEPNAPNRHSFHPISRTEKGRTITLVETTRYSLLYNEPGNVYDSQGNFLFYEEGDFLTTVYHFNLRFALQTIMGIEDSEGNPPPEPVRQPNPPSPIAESASKTALVFYFKKDFKSEPIKLLEINEKEPFEAIVVKNKTVSIAIIKTGRAKENEFILDSGGDSCSGDGGGTWNVYDLESWYKLTSFNESGYIEGYTYDNYLNWVASLNDDYQYWRYSGYYIYPAASGDICSLGNEYLSLSGSEEKYETIAKYQALTNVYTTNRRVDVELLNGLVNNKSLNITGGELLGNINAEEIFLKVTAYSTRNNSSACDIRKLQDTRIGLSIPLNTVFIIAKGVLK